MKKLPKNSTIKTYLWCAIIALFLWASLNFSREYDSIIQFDIEYQNIPIGLNIRKETPKTIELLVNEVGFKLLQWKIFSPKVSIQITEPNEKLMLYWNNKQLTQKIAESNYRKYQIKSVIPNELRISFDQKIQRKLPITPEVELKLESSYQVKQIKLKPDSILLFGNHSDFPKNQAIKTVLLTINKKALIQKGTIALNLNDYTNLNSNLQKVSYELELDRYTEHHSLVQINPENIPANASVKLFPNKMKVIYQVSFALIKKISPENFILEANFQNVDFGKQSKVKLELKSHPAFIQNPKTEQNEVEFLILKQ